MNEENNTIDHGFGTAADPEAIKKGLAELRISDNFFRLPDERDVKFTKDIGKGAVQFGLESLGLINRLLPTTGMGTADPDYYGGYDFVKETFFPDEHEGGITIPLSEIQENQPFMNHMKGILEFEQQNNLTALEDLTGLDLSAAKQNPNQALPILTDLMSSPDITDENAQSILNFMDNAKANKHPITGGKPMFEYSEDGSTMTFNYMPKVDEGLFGFDMTLDPQFTSKGDLSLPGFGTWGMRDGELTQLAASTMRPLDELSMEGSPGADWVRENVTDKLAWQGPAMYPPEGAGIGYMIPQFLGMAKTAGTPLYKAGQAAYKYPKTAASVGIPSALFGKKLFASDEE
jgi:hypothetical protein